MKAFIKKLIRILLSPFILKDYFSYKKLDSISGDRFAVRFRDFYPQIRDKTIQTGFDRHYIYHTAWAARILATTKPAKHIDISSSIYFSAITSAFIPIDFYDYRPANLKLDNLTNKKADLMSLPFTENSINSISCMHTIEHIGLGRYGDPIDPNGDIKAINELKRVLAMDGSLLFVTPIGKIPKIEFNAHRIYSHEQILSLFNDLELREFALIKEHEGGIIRNASSDDIGDESYACGCFWFTK